MRYFLIITLLISFLGLYSQINQIGIGLIELNTYNQKINNTDTSITSNAKSTLNFKPIFSFNHTNKNDIDFSLQLGYFPEHLKINQKVVYSDKSVNYSYSSNTKQTWYCKVGFAKRINLNKFYFLLGVQIPFSVNYKSYNEIKNTINDSLGKFIQYQGSTNNLPNTYYTGILINIGTFYKLYKNIYIGGEINYGIYYSLLYGNRTYTTNSNNNLGINTSDSKQLKYNQSQFQLALNPTIHIRVMIPHKNKSENSTKN